MGPSFYVIQVEAGIEFVVVSVVKTVPDMVDLALVFVVQPDLFATDVGEVALDVAAVRAEPVLEAVVGEAVVGEVAVVQLVQLVVESMSVVVDSSLRQLRLAVHLVFVYLANPSEKVAAMQPFVLDRVAARLQ